VAFQVVRIERQSTADTLTHQPSGPETSNRCRSAHDGPAATYFIVEPSRAPLAELARRIDGGAPRPVVDVLFPIADARQASQHQPTRGEVVLRVVDAGVGRSAAMIE
jgi:hypothetical protein